MPRIHVLVPALMLLVSVPSFAAFNMVQTGHVGGPGTNVKNVAAEGSHAFLAVDANLTVLDITDPEHPDVLAEVALPSTAEGITVVNGIAYVADGPGGLLIYDVSTPSSPALLATHAFEAVHVYWQDDYLYVCGGLSGLRILNVANPASPQVYSTWDHPNPNTYLEDIEVRGYTAYVGARYQDWEYAYASLLVLDISTPVTYFLKTIDGGSGSMRLATAFRYLYGSSQSGSWIWDLLADPNNPALVKTFAGGFVDELTYADGYLYAFSYLGLRIFDVSPPASTFQTQLVTYAGGGRGVLVEDQIFHACRDHGVRILERNALDLGQATKQGGWDRMTTASRLLQSGDILYVGGERLWILDASQPGPPVVIGDVHVENVWGLGKSGNYLYAGGDPELVVVDVSNPSSPVVVKRIPNRIMDLEIRGNFLYALELGGLRLYELTDPANPSPRSFHAQGGRWHLAVHDNYVYMSSPNWDFVTINDYTNPDAPVYVANSYFKAWEMEVVDGKLYSASSEAGFQVYDLANPLVPALLGGVPFANSRGVFVDGARVGVADIWYGVSVLDVSNPANPVVLGDHEEEPGVQLSDVVVRNDNVYTAAHDEGLYVYDLLATSGVGEPAVPAPLTVTAAPNPFSSGTSLSVAGAASGPASLRIHDAAGRLVREFDLMLATGSERVAWDGRDHAGRPVPAGVYFAMVTTGDVTARERITVVR